MSRDDTLFRLMMILVSNVLDKKKGPSHRYSDSRPVIHFQHTPEDSFEKVSSVETSSTRETQTMYQSETQGWV